MTKNAQKFWEKNLKPRFDSASLNYTVKLVNGNIVRYVNLDNAATTTPFLNVTQGLMSELNEYGSVHRGSGQKSRVSTQKYEETRDVVKQFVNAKDEYYVVFVPNTTAGINQLAYSLAHIKGKIIVSDIEHSSSFLPWVFQEGRHQNTSQITLEDALKNNTDDINNRIMRSGQKKVITYSTKEDFTFDLDNLEKIVAKQHVKGEDEKIKAIVVTGASNVTGYKPPLKKISEIAHKYGALVVVDACQLLQHEKIDMNEQGIDFVLFSGHKMYAPFGSGAIVGNKQILDAFWPYQMGGGNFPYITADGEVLRYKNNQAHDPGTPNFVGARALDYAIKEFEDIGVDKIVEYEHMLVKAAFLELTKIDGITTYTSRNDDGSFDKSLITFNIKGFDSKLVSEILNDNYGVGTRAGSYCVYEFSRRISGISNAQEKDIAQEVRNGVTANIPGSVRASFSLINSPQDVDRLIGAVQDMVKNGPESYLKNYVRDAASGDWMLKSL